MHWMVDPRGEITGNGENRFSQAEAVAAAAEFLEDYAGKVQMIYLDPPFFTGQKFIFRQRVGTAGWSGDPHFVLEHIGYEDGRGMTREEYLSWMREVLAAARELLCEEGSLFLQVDWRLSAHIRLLLDVVFGERNFLNEIIWHYQSGGTSRQHFSRKHDTIFFYRKTPQVRLEMENAGQRRGKEARNHLKREEAPDGTVSYSIVSNGKLYRYSENDILVPSDVWTDIPHLQQKSPERWGYASQKPEALLERMILATTRPGDTVCDLFAGSGTTAAVAWRMGRHFLASDEGVFSLHTCRKRLLGAPMTMRFGRARHTSPEMELSWRREQGKTIATLNGFYIPGREKFLHATNFLWDAPLVDSFALGYLKEGWFHRQAASIRTVQTPEISQELWAITPPDTRAAVLLTDVCGGVHCLSDRQSPS